MLAALAFFCALDPFLADTRAPSRAWCAPGIDHPSLADPICIAPGRGYAPSFCAAVERAAMGAGAPPAFLARLLWKESLFDPDAVSHKGAQGVAQFMPATARRRGLEDPFNPAAALRASAIYLAHLDARFGSLGMAAVAYNAGEARAEAVLRGRRGAPAETQGYVAEITGHPVSAWVSDPPARATVVRAMRLRRDVSFQEGCVALAETRRLAPPQGLASGPRPAWGVRLAGHAKRHVAQRYLRQLRVRRPGLLAHEPGHILLERRRRYGAYLGRSSRAEALRLCRRLRAKGVACTIRRL
ncbi:MAG: lytic transglycosylase domain-containing protein [Pseudomonadota bacterium]